jgi:hypothetical protein
MINERDLLLQSLTPTDAEWAVFESRFRGKTPDCPLTADLISFAREQAPPELAGRIRPHLQACGYCHSWVLSCRRALAPDEPEEQAASPAVHASACLRPATIRDEQETEHGPWPSGVPAKSESTPGLSNVFLTGIFTMILKGRPQEALQLLQPYLPDVLTAVGLGPDLADRLWQFLVERLPSEPGGTPASLPQWLQSFAREKLRYPDLPHRPAAEEWKPIVARCALRCVQASREEPEPVRRFLEAALERGVKSVGGLDRFREKEEAYRTAISGEDLRDLINRVSREQKRVARLFGLS